MPDFRSGALAYEAGNYPLALEHWLPLAESGHMVAQKSIAVMYGKGQGVPADQTRAAHWYQRAAAQGHATAQFKLAMMIAFGNGVERDPLKAYIWLARAQASFPPGLNRDKAAEMADMLAGGMPAADLDLANAEIAALRASGRLIPLASPPRRLDPADPAKFKTTVLDFLRRTKLAGDTLFAGTVQVLGLKELHTKLGPDWAKYRDRIVKVADEVIELHLTELDLYVRHGEDTIILVFGSALKPEAENIARAIALEIENRLSGFLPVDADISVQSVTVPVDPGRDGVAVTSFDALTRTVAQARASVEAESQGRAATVGAAMRPVYWPVLHLRRRTVSVYDARLPVEPPNDPMVDLGIFYAEVDAHTLAAVGADLARAGDAHRKAVALVPVHYETLANRARREKFLAACRKLPPSSSRRMILHLIDLSDSVPQGRLYQILSIVAPFFLGFAARVAASITSVERFAGMKVMILSVDGSRRAQFGKPELVELYQLAEKGRKRRMRILYQNARSPEIATTVKRVGVTYVDGPAVIPETANFGRVYRLP